MGTDNLFHKKKERKSELLRRRSATKAPYDVILIVCEGAKTEPNYFNELKKAFRLSNANVRICGRGSDPLSVVDFAIATFRREQEFDRVYCVFDRDRHTTYSAALDKVRRTRLGKGSKIIATPSVPCFEFWLLLHFAYTTRPFDAPAGDSICAKVIEESTIYLPEYQKGDQDIFNKIQDKRRVANYRKYDESGNLVHGKFAKWFEESFKAIKSKSAYKGLIPFSVEDVHNGYFSQDMPWFKNMNGFNPIRGVT